MQGDGAQNCKTLGMEARSVTAQELSDEYGYIYWERVGLLIGTADLTLSADYMAQQEADEAIRKLREME